MIRVLSKRRGCSVSTHSQKRVQLRFAMQLQVEREKAADGGHGCGLARRPTPISTRDSCRCATVPAIPALCHMRLSTRLTPHSSSAAATSACSPSWPTKSGAATGSQTSALLPIARLTHKPALLDELLPPLRQHSRAVWRERFNAAGVPCAPVHTVPEAIASPQVQALGMMRAVPGEDFCLTALPVSFDGKCHVHRAVAPRLGEHLTVHGVTAHKQRRQV